MFLSKKSFIKILILTIGYFLLGSICIILSFLFYAMGVPAESLFALGIIIYILCVLMFFCGRYAEGKGKLINLGNKLVRKELRPAEFIDRYLSFKNASDLVIQKPDVDVLALVATAYDCLHDQENALATVDEMVAVASEKKRAYANLLKASFLFAYGKKDEAEKLFNETQKMKLNMMSKALADVVMKGDRAMAMGDYKTVEIYHLQLLEQRFPKHDPLAKLIIHHVLAEVYEKMRDHEKAVYYYQYCATHGGETAMKNSAIERLHSLKAVE